ncbi:hypothetical protein LEMLEM_LOCUS27157, partial [Lemmus lemmus]
GFYRYTLSEVVCVCKGPTKDHRATGIHSAAETYLTLRHHLLMRTLLSSTPPSHRSF